MKTAVALLLILLQGGAAISTQPAPDQVSVATPLKPAIHLDEDALVFLRNWIITLRSRHGLSELQPAPEWVSSFEFKKSHTLLADGNFFHLAQAFMSVQPGTMEYEMLVLKLHGQDARELNPCLHGLSENVDLTSGCDISDVDAKLKKELDDQLDQEPELKAAMPFGTPYRVQATMLDWWKSPGHHANLMATDISSFAVVVFRYVPDPRQPTPYFFEKPTEGLLKRSIIYSAFAGRSLPPPHRKPSR